MAKGRAKKAKPKGKEKPGKEKMKTTGKPREPAGTTINSNNPVKIKCPFCKKTMTTKVVYNPKRSAIVTLFSCCCPGSYKGVAQHFCSKCKKFIGRAK